MERMQRKQDEDLSKALERMKVSRVVLKFYFY